MDSLTDEEVAARAAVDAKLIDRYVRAGVISPDPTHRFRPPDVARIRFVAALEESGISLDDLSGAIAEGRISLRFVDELMPDPMSYLPSTALTWDDEALAATVGPILGSLLGEGDRVRRDDVEVLEILQRAVAMGAPIDRVARIVRSTAMVVAKLVELQREFVDDVLLEPAIAEFGSPLLALEATSAERYAYRTLGRRLTGLLLERFVDDAVFANMVRFVEAAIAHGGIGLPSSPAAIVFIDVSRYTTRSEEEGDEVAASQAIGLAAFVQDLAIRYDARLVKSLGDGAMVHVEDPSRAVDLALEAVESVENRGLWAVHAGVNAGYMVRRDGDYYGTAVNVASRVADHAQEGEVLVTEAIATLPHDPGIVFVPRGAVELDHVAEPVVLYEARR